MLVVTVIVHLPIVDAVTIAGGGAPRHPRILGSS
jgi:hypothetical protein